MIPYAYSVLTALGLMLPPVTAEPNRQSWRDCGMQLTRKAGLTSHDGESMLDNIERYSVIRPGYNPLQYSWVAESDDQYDEFMRYMVALIFTESRFRVNARSHMGAIGLMQITPQAADHIHMIQRAVGLRPRKVPVTKLSQIPINVNIGSYYLWMSLQEARGNWIGALAMYNSGYYGFRQLNRGANLPAETSQYIVRIMNLVSSCSK